MTIEQRTMHMKKVFSAQVSNAYHSSTDKAIQFGKEKSTQTLSVTVESAAALLPIGNIEGIWQKATTLLQKEGAIAPAVPGKDPKARMVLSYSSDYPHLVTTGKKKGSYMCDVKCPNWKSQNLCSHSVAVAEINCELHHFLSCRKKKCSVTDLITCTMPKGRGNKGGVPSISRQRKAVNKSLEDSRIPLIDNLEDAEDISTGCLSSVSTPSQYRTPSRSFGMPAGQFVSSPNFSSMHVSCKELSTGNI